MAANEDSSCLFCGILKGIIPSHKVTETDYSLAFLDIMPFSEGHTLVIPKYHAETLDTLPDEYLRDIGPLLKRVAKAAGTTQYNIVQNNGKLAYQQVPHAHFHVIPKSTETDGLVLHLEERPQAKSTNEELAATCAKMKERLSQ
ncbi:HIT domain protein [Mycena indigotica]|uniref:HIT domain protein n=1 Tax=Mycena indigotica TaxID=2126181 RepID=A0A8H6WC07_9AGAR|nr:HIT domain protein [Mycena indigotica]KAF7306849.1 HIT domain protein [Mycena indigotica]